MRILLGIQIGVLAGILLVASGVLAARIEKTENTIIPLPTPQKKGDLSVESALQNRRSIRRYKKAPLSKEILSQILWAAQGINRKSSNPPALWGDRSWPGGLRTAPSAGALYPLDVYVAVGDVEDLSPGVYRYLPGKQALEKTAEGDRREELCQAALRQSFVREGAVVLIISGVYARSAAKYGDRAQRYTHIETGAVGQSIYLQAESLGLGTVMVGAFDDKKVQSVLGLSQDEIPLAIMPIGKKF
ncbi:MAG: SagB/ThcOx family dehydrogenase [Candidatus Aminicenantes bacterium]